MCLFGASAIHVEYLSGANNTKNEKDNSPFDSGFSFFSRAALARN